MLAFIKKDSLYKNSALLFIAVETGTIGLVITKYIVPAGVIVSTLVFAARFQIMDDAGTFPVGEWLKKQAYIRILQQ